MLVEAMGSLEMVKRNGWAAAPSPVVAEVLAESSFAGARVDFAPDLRFGIEALLRAATA